MMYDKVKSSATKLIDIFISDNTANRNKTSKIVIQDKFDITNHPTPKKKRTIVTNIINPILSSCDKFDKLFFIVLIILLY